MSKTLAVNPGSTSVKYTLFNKQNESICNVQLNKNENDCSFLFETEREKFKDTLELSIFDNSFQYLIKILKEKNLLADISEIKKCGVRVVHGGPNFSKPTLINENVFKEIEEISILAPLHNPPAIKIIKELRACIDEVYAIFDTAFHTTIPEYSAIYAIPANLSEKHQVRRYGFHGIAYQSAIRKIKDTFGEIDEKAIFCHLGGGCSCAAVLNGESVETSMGLTPLEGLIMNTRSGDIDVGVVEYLAKQENKTLDEMITMLNKESGLFGLSGTKDVKTIVDKSLENDKVCLKTINAFVHRLIKYIGAYSAVLGGCDTIVFSGGIGENSADVRKMIINKLSYLGFELDENNNKKSGDITNISANNKKIIIAQIDESDEMVKQIS